MGDTAANIVTEDTYAEFGGRQFTLRPFSPGQIIKFTRLFTSVLKGLAKDIKPGENPDIEVMDIVGNLSEEHLVDLVALIVYNNDNFDVKKESFGVAQNFARENFTALSAVKLIRSWFEREDIKELFLEVRKIAMMFRLAS